MKSKYSISDTNLIDEGGSSEFYLINKDLGFKQFRNKNTALAAYKRQKLLSKFDLAPKVIGVVRKIPIKFKTSWSEDFLAKELTMKSNWGYITEMAKVVSESVMSKKLKQLQNLVDDIKAKTNLKFWDCHYFNVGYVNRNGCKKLVCIDTGPESFKSDSNTWGNSTPGPKCSYCNTYITWGNFYGCPCDCDT
jgi:hypothetical protein